MDMRKKMLQRGNRFFCCFSLLLAFVCVMTGCGSLKDSFNPNKEYPKEKLQEDYHIIPEHFAGCASFALLVQKQKIHWIIILIMATGTLEIP